MEVPKLFNLVFWKCDIEYSSLQWEHNLQEIAVNYGTFSRPNPISRKQLTTLFFFLANAPTEQGM